MRYKKGVKCDQIRQQCAAANVKTMITWKGCYFYEIQRLRECALLNTSKHVLTMITN